MFFNCSQGITPKIDTVFINDMRATKDVPNIIASGTFFLGLITESAVEPPSSKPTKPQKAIILEDIITPNKLIDVEGLVTVPVEKLALSRFVIANIGTRINGSIFITTIIDSNIPAHLIPRMFNAVNDSTMDISNINLVITLTGPVTCSK